MFASRTFSWPSRALFMFFAVVLATGQDSAPTTLPPGAAHISPAAPANKGIVFDDFIDSVVLQERRLTDSMRSFKPIIETYIQEEGVRPRFQAGIIPNGDDYFLSRLELTGDSLSFVPFADEETWKRTEEFFVQEPAPLSQAALAQGLFPDLGHFDRQNYIFEFVRWDVLGEVRCAALDVRPREHSNTKNRGFVGRIWVEDQDYSIVRFTGTFTSTGFAKRAFHFDSWRLNVQRNQWMPAYVYTEESNPHYLDLAHRLLFRAQTKVWGYDLQNARDHLENEKPLTDNPARVNSRQQENSREVRPAYGDDETPYPPEDTVVERAEAAGLMAPEGDVDQILQTVLNNLLITNDLDIPGVRCRVLLTTPLESFVMGRTIVVSRGLLDVLPDEATLAAVLAHELAHVLLGHTVSPAYLVGIAQSSSDSQIFAALDFHFDRNEEKGANKKAQEVLSKSPYKDQLVNVGLFLQTLDARSARFPNLLHGRFSEDFGSNRLFASPKLPKADRLNQISALPLGSRIVVDPWSDRIEMLKSKPIRLASPAEKIPFEVTPFHPYLKRLDVPENSHNATGQ